MRRLAYACCMLLALSANANAATPVSAPPKLLAVFFYASWCPNCPPVEAAIHRARREGNLDARGVRFVTLDMSSKAQIRQAVAQADALGIGDYLRMRGGGVGYMTLFDAASKQELHRFYRTSSGEDVRRAIERYLAR